MTDIWLPGFERITSPASAGATIRRPDAPARGVLHTTEVPSADLRRLAATHKNPPQVWASARERIKIQSTPLNRAARALVHPPGTVETNHMGVCVQVEIHARAADTPWFSREDLDWLADEVLAPISYVMGIPEHAWLPTRGSEAYGTNGPARMTAAQWSAFHGWTTHQAVPANSHWDAGAIDLAYLVHRAHHPPTATEVPPMSTTEPVSRDSFLTVKALEHGVSADEMKAPGGAYAHVKPLATVAQLAETERRILARIDELPLDATDPELAQLVADRLDQIIAALDGITLDDGTTATGDDARRLIAELIGATIP